MQVKRDPVVDAAARASISVFFPAYNDWGTIASLVCSSRAVLRELTDDWEVIVVNDGSPDHTAEILAELQPRYPRLRVVTHEQNRGYGGALRSGFAAATKEWVFYTDGDAQYDVARARAALGRARRRRPGERLQDRALTTRCTASSSARSTTGS